MDISTPEQPTLPQADQAPIQVPTADTHKVLDKSPGDVIVISQTTLYVFLTALVFFAAGFGVAWMVFSSNGNSTANAASTAAAQAVTTAIAQLVAAQPTATLIPRQDVKFAPDSSSWGPADAKVTIVEYSDFQCPYCEDFFQHTYPQIKQNYSDKIRFVFQYFPLTEIHPDADEAANAAACAKEQNKFWEYHDELFNNQSDLSPTALVKYAQAVKIGDLNQFSSCLDAKKYESTIQSQIQAGSGYFVSGTPTFFVNGNILIGAQPYAAFKQMIDAALAETQSQAATAPATPVSPAP